MIRCTLVALLLAGCGEMEMNAGTCDCEGVDPIAFQETAWVVDATTYDDDLVGATVDMAASHVYLEVTRPDGTRVVVTYDVTANETL